MDAELTAALDDLILGRGVARGRHSLRSRGDVRSARNSRSASRPTDSVPMTVREGRIEPGERVPAFSLHGDTADFGYIRWEIFTPRSRRKLFQSEYRRPDNQEWAVQLNLSLARARSGRRRSARSGTTSRPSWRSTRDRAPPSRRSPSACSQCNCSILVDEEIARSGRHRSRRRARADPAGARERRRASRWPCSTHTPTSTTSAPRERCREATGAPILSPPGRSAALRRAARPGGALRSDRRRRRRPSTRRSRTARRFASGGSALRAIHTPGHTPGSTCFELSARRPPPLLRRHALSPLDRPHGPLGRRHGGDPRLDPREALPPARRPAASSAGTAPTRRSRRRSGENPFAALWEPALAC